MATTQQINVTVYKIGTTVINPVQYLPFPASQSVLSPATLDDISYVKTSIHFQDMGTWKSFYVSETVASLVSGSNN